MDLKKQYTDFIKSKSFDLGFMSCGISKSGFLASEADRFESWLKNNYHGKMSYMERNFDKRLDTTKLVEGSKSVISLTYNYFPKRVLKNDDTFKISKYAYGKDYHIVLKKKLKQLLNIMQTKFGHFEGRVFVDSAPILERAWAKKSGLGWIGKNSLLINKNQGSFFFLAEIICDLELEYDEPVLNRCGNCSRCIDACPTDAITKPQISIKFKFSFKNNQAIKAEVAGIRKNIETVLLAELYLIRNINIVNAPKETNII